MCQPKPGPRCSSHARKALTRLGSRVDSLKAEFQEEKAELDAMTPGSPEAREQKDYLNDLAQARLKAEENFYQAQEDYDATPDGMVELQQAIKENQAQPTMTPDVERHNVYLNQRLQQGVSKRRAQMLALNTLRAEIEAGKAEPLETPQFRFTRQSGRTAGFTTAHCKGCDWVSGPRGGRDEESAVEATAHHRCGDL